MASQPLKVTDRVILVFEDRFLLLDEIHGEYTSSIEAEARKPSFKQGALKAVLHQPTQEATILYTLLAVFPSDRFINAGTSAVIGLPLCSFERPHY